MKKQILKDFELTEISGVDKPAQPTAKVSIMKSAEKTAGDSGKLEKTESNDMTDKVAELEKSLAEVKATLEKAVADKAAAEAIAKLSDEQKEFVAKMGDKDKEDYMKMSDEEKKKKMFAMKKNDETLVVNGQTISKSAVGDASFEVFKSLATEASANAARLEKAEKAAETARLEKRAETEFGNMAGETVAKVALLAEIEKMDAGAKAFALGLMKSANDFAKEAGTKIGTVAKAAENSPQGKLEKRIAEIRKSDAKLSEEQAMVKALDENPDLYTELEGAK